MQNSCNVNLASNSCGNTYFISNVPRSYGNNISHERPDKCEYNLCQNYTTLYGGHKDGDAAQVTNKRHSSCSDNLVGKSCDNNYSTINIIGTYSLPNMGSIDIHND